MKKLLSLISSISIVIPTSGVLLAMSPSNSYLVDDISITNEYVKTNNLKVNKSNANYIYSINSATTVNNLNLNETSYIYGNRDESSIYIMTKDENNEYVEKEFITLDRAPKQVYVYNNYLHIIVGDGSNGTNNYYANASDLLNSWVNKGTPLTVADFSINPDWSLLEIWDLYVSTNVNFALYGYQDNFYLTNLDEKGLLVSSQYFKPTTFYIDNKDFSESINIAMSDNQSSIGLVKTDTAGETKAITSEGTIPVQAANNKTPVITTYISKVISGQTPTVKNYMFDNDRIVEIDIFATKSGNVIEKGTAITFTDGAKVKSAAETIDPKTGNPAIYTVTDKGVYLLVSTSSEHLIPTDTNTYTVERLSNESNTLSSTAIRVAGNSISSYNYSTRTIEQVVKKADLSALSQEKIALDEAILAQGSTNREVVQEHIVNKIIEVATSKNILDQIALISTTDLYNLIDIDDAIANLTPNDSYNNWYKSKTYTLGKTNPYITSADVLFSSNTKLEFLKTNTIEYTKAIQAGIINDQTTIQMIVDDLNNQLQAKDKNLEIVVPNSIEVQKGQEINFDVKPIDGLNVDSSLTSSIKVEFTNVQTPLDLTVIAQEIQKLSPLSVNGELTTEDSVAKYETYLNNAIKGITNIEQTTVKLTDTQVNAQNGTWTANVLLSETGMETNFQKFTIQFSDIAKAKSQMTGSWAEGSDGSKFVVGQTMQYNISNWQDVGTISVSESKNFTTNVANGVISVTATAAASETLKVSATDASNTINLKVTSYLGELDYGSETSFSLNEGKTKTFKLNNAAVFSDFKVDSQNTDNIEVTVDKNGTIKVKALKFEEEGKTYSFTINATNSMDQTKSQTFSVELLAKAPFPIWAIILLAILGGAIVLGGLGFLIWFLVVRIIIPAKNNKKRKHRSRTAQITADKNAVAKGKVTKIAKINHDKGLERSGLFERELEYNLDKMNDPDYEKKYVWVQDEGTEDNSPVLNNWNTDEQQTKDELKKGKNTKKK
ncbi:hypothetical protein [Spiroplasma culicicola]|uniref:Uncharacterized protein n=1 Tax=Spiroplasma culicicola AES-1 TaxID=1276246 RepID=W6A7M2_9MOLU|nr:hypothetical protein [Spiroplasma culicicola]AHI52981.1 hypothetical protein SCULI_v1c06400 [Spiroplasma culicicola AES-1]